MRKYSLTLLLSSALILSSGCSFLFVDGPPREELWGVPSVADSARCSDSYVWPVVDTIGVPADVLTAMVLSKGKDEFIFFTGIGWGVLRLVSAWWGYSKVANCNAFIDAKIKRLRQTQARLRLGPKPKFDDLKLRFDRDYLKQINSINDAGY